MSKSSYENVSFVTSVEVDSAKGMAFFQTDAGDAISEEVCLCAATYSNRFDTPRDGMKLRTFVYNDELWVFCSDAFKFMLMSSGGSRLSKLDPSNKGTVTIMGLNYKNFNAFSMSGFKEFLSTVGKNSTQYRKVVAQNLIQTLEEAESIIKTDSIGYAKGDTAFTPIVSSASYNTEETDSLVVSFPSAEYDEANTSILYWFEQFNSLRHCSVLELEHDELIQVRVWPTPFSSNNFPELKQVYHSLGLDDGASEVEAIQVIIGAIRQLSLDLETLLSKKLLV
jgi:hypothetical protein